MPNLGLDETIDIGEGGHILAHDIIHDKINPLYGNWTVIGGQEGLLEDRPTDLDVNNIGFLWWSTDIARLDLWDGANWQIIGDLNAINQTQRLIGTTLGQTHLDSGNDLVIDFDTNWGINGGVPYWDSDYSVVPEDEKAILTIDATGGLRWVLVSEIAARVGTPMYAEDNLSTLTNPSLALTNLGAAAAGAIIASTLGDAKGDLIGFSAADTPARIAAASADNRIVMSDSTTSTGIRWARPGAVIVEAHTDTVISTTGEQTVFTATVPGGSVTTGDLLILRCSGRYNNNTGGNVNYQWRSKIAGATVQDTGTQSKSSSATDGVWALDMYCVVTAAGLRVREIFTIGASVNSTGMSAVASGSCLVGTNEVTTLDVSVDWTVSLTMQTNVNAATLTLKAATLEVVKKRVYT